MRNLLILIAIIFLLAAPAFAGAPSRGDQAPDFSLTSVTGESISLSSLKGKVILIGMFHICVPCMNQAMEFNKVRKQLDNEDLVILGINTSGDKKEAVQKYLNSFPQPVQFPYLLDPEQTVHKNYIQRDMPTVLVVDRKGVLQARSPSVGVDQLVPFLKELL